MKQGGHTSGQKDGQNDTQDKTHRSIQPAEEVRQRKLDGRAAEQVVDLVLGSHRHGENGVGISAQKHEARLAQREQASKAVEQVHGHGHQGIDSAFLQHYEQLAGGSQGVFQHDDQNEKRHCGSQAEERARPVFFL